MKKVDYTKTLVRNTVQPTQTGAPTKERVKSGNKNDQITKKANVDNCKLDKPEIQSTLKLSKAIDNISKHKQTNCITNNEKLAVDEKVISIINIIYYFTSNEIF